MHATGQSSHSSATAAERAVSRCRRLPTNPPFRVLVFMPIGREHSDIAADKCAKITRMANVSLFLAHYDDSQNFYASMPWYAQVEFKAVVAPAIKIVLAKQLLLKSERMRTLLLTQFSHVWVTDDDVAFPAVPTLRRFLDVASDLDAAIVQPATKGSVHGLVQPTSPSQCAVARSTDFVEFQSPLMARCVFLEAVGLMHRSHYSDYGLDMVWCRWFGSHQQYPRWNMCNVCAVVEVAGFEKRYGTAHTHSYNRSAALEDDRHLRGLYAPYESLCTIVGACRGGGQTAIINRRRLESVGGTHRPRPYREVTCTAPRPGLVIDGPCGRWRAAARK